jgi:hypothetical protein
MGLLDMKNKHINNWFVAVIVALLLISVGFAVLWKSYKNHIEVEKAIVEHEYYHQNIAFGMENASRKYQDFSYVSINRLNIKLAAYYFEVENADITVDDIKDYLSSEYGEEGQLKVLNPSQKIAEYLEWYWHEGGAEATVEYGSWLKRYKIDHEDIYGNDEIFDMNENLLCMMIADFNSCSDQDIYMDFEKWDERHLGD